MDIKSDIDQMRKESFFQTPLWYLEESRWGWLKDSSPSVLKRSLHNPNTPFGIGKIIELSIYPQITAIYSIILPKTHKDMSQEDLLVYVNSSITEIESHEERIILLPKEKESPSPEELEVHLRSFWNLYISIHGIEKTAKALDIDPGEVISYLVPLTFEKGNQIEALSQ